jgi:hypothetical protein
MAPFNISVLSLRQVTSSGVGWVLGKSAFGQRQLGIGNRTTLAPSCPWLEAPEIQQRPNDRKVVSLLEE